jgi:gamma-glutamyltranspeptidase
LLGCLVFGQTPDQAVRAPRILIPLGPDTIMVDPGTPEQHKEDLAFRGERVAEARFRSHAVQVLSRRDGVVRAASDPRKFGEALVH